MSYEYKEEIMDDVSFEPAFQYPHELNTHNTKVEEIKEVYSKAEAFDEIFKLYIGYEDGWISFPRGHKSFNKAVIDVCKQYESGEQNV